MRPQQPAGNLNSLRGTRRSDLPRLGFSMAELVVVIGIIAVLAALLLSAISRVRRSAQSATCLSNLRNISVAFHAYASESDLRYPDPASTTISWEAILQPYLNQTMVFACPSDLEVFPATGSSYDWRDTRDPATTLAGRRISDPVRGDTVVAFETLPGWHARHMMNAVLADGSCLSMTEDGCLGDLRLPLVPAGSQGADGRPH
jgi:prepilin-type N-terminal cleavage/methylation domain-containing protein